MTKTEIRAILRDLPTRTTERLTLRRLSESDAGDVYEYASREEVSRYLLWDRHTDPVSSAKTVRDLVSMYDTDEYYEWAVVLRETDKMIGTCGFTDFGFRAGRAEIGYSFHPDYWGVGYATEAVRETLRFGFEVLGLARIEARFALLNVASGKVLAHCGFSYLGEEEPMMIKGNPYRIGLYAITKEEYEKMVPDKT